jgi:hypothetical protein
MAQNDIHGRKYERIPCNGATATLIVPGGSNDRNNSRVDVAIENISRGGAALRSAWTGAVGDAVQLVVPGLPAPLDARVVRYNDDVLAVAFRQDDTTLARVDAAAEALTGGQALAA